MFAPKRSKQSMLDSYSENILRSRFIAGNTLEIETDREIIVNYHDTAIIKRNKRSGSERLFTGGFYTKTTKDRLNTHSRNIKHIYQEGGVWYVTNGKMSSVFYDGILIKKDGSIPKPRFNDPNAKTKKLLKAYLDKLKALDTLPLPDGGDCWICKGVAGEAGRTCLMSHLKEGYIHGTLIYNALKDNGYNDYNVGSHFRDTDGSLRYNVINAVRRYFKSKLGIPR